MMQGNLLENLTTKAWNGKKTLQYGVEHLLKELCGTDWAVRHQAKERRVRDVDGATKNLIAFAVSLCSLRHFHGGYSEGL